MGTFTGTADGKSIYPGYVSPGVVANPPGTSPGAESDTIYGNGGSDYIESSDGNDTVYGGSGNDTVYSGNGDDFIDDYTDASYGGSDTFYGGFGNDTIYGVDGDDTLYGEDGADSIYGEEDDDILVGGVGADFMAGGSGSDTYYVDNTGDIVEEVSRGELDQVYASVSFTISAYVEDLYLDGTAAINATGNQQSNHIYGNDSANIILGFGADDSLFGYGGNDRIEGGEGVDWLNGGAGADILVGNGGDDGYVVDSILDQNSEASNSGIDLVFAIVNGWVLGSNIEDLILEGNSEALVGTGNSLANHIVGNGNDNELFGGGGADAINGSDGNDRIDGGTGADYMYGEYDNDIYFVDNAGDLVRENVSEGNDTVFSTASFTLGSNVETIYLRGSANVNATGNAQDNLVAGNSFANTLLGLGGADTFQSGNGADRVVGGAGNDVFQFLSTIGSNPSARDTLAAGDGAVAFERPGALLGDRIDVSAIEDANTVAGGIQDFVFGTSHLAGRLWAVDSGDLTLIRGNTNGNAAAEFEIAIQDGPTVRALDYTGADFLV